MMVATGLGIDGYGEMLFSDTEFQLTGGICFGELLYGMMAKYIVCTSCWEVKF